MDQRVEEDDHESVPLSGNAFVDTGLGVIASLAGLDDVEDLTREHMRQVHGDGGRLASWNSSLKCFSMVFTSNSLLTNPSIKDKGKRIAAYAAVVNALLSAIGSEDLPDRCRACGTARSLDLDSLCRTAIPGNLLKQQTRFVGRDWFPLSGSLGSDAQALPAASRPVNLCATCLFAVHYLPLGLILLDGRLAVFQSTAIPFWYELVRDISTEVCSRVAAGNCETIGKKEGSRAFILRLLALLERIKTGFRLREIPTATSLQIWRFSNSGTGPECTVEEIPNAALLFLWEAVRAGHRNEIATLIGNEARKDRPFLRCIAEGVDYAGLYPRQNKAGVSPDLFCLYQTRVCQRSVRSLGVAAVVARIYVAKTTRSELRRAQREEAFANPVTRRVFRTEIADLADIGKIKLDDYHALFPKYDDALGTRVRFDGWQLIRYFLHHANFAPPSAPSQKDLRDTSECSLLRYSAYQIFDNYVSYRGKDRFRANVLDGLRHSKIGMPWLQRRFVSLAEFANGFDYSRWRLLCGEPPAAAEVLFQMRLLWSEWLRSGVPDKPSDVDVHEFQSGLSPALESSIKDAFEAYVDKRGLARFHRDILIRLGRREIGLRGLKNWITPQADSGSQTFSPQGRQNIVELDEDGSPTASQLVFKTHLLLANLYRRKKL